MIQEIYIIDEDNNLYHNLVKLFEKEKKYRFKCINHTNIDIALKNIPSLIIINEDTLESDIIELCNKIHLNDDNRITPIVVISSNTEYSHRLNVLKASVEHFIRSPINEQYFYYTIINILKLIEVNRTVSPLTGLPGNVQIQAEMKKRFMNKERFFMLYLDLDNFKAYNDAYGFVKGDDIIRFTSKIILKNVHEIDSEKGFVGHIGGDDFVAIISNDNYEELCQNIILDFDYNVLDFFNDQDIQKGFIEVMNRKGVMEQFPLTSISIAVVEVAENNFKNILEIGEAGAQVKRLSKTIRGSTYVVDKRKMP